MVYANGTTSPDEIRRVLTSSAKDLGASGWDTVYGHGMIDPVAALAVKERKPSKTGKIVMPKARASAMGLGRAMTTLKALGQAR